MEIDQHWLKMAQKAQNRTILAQNGSKWVKIALFGPREPPKAGGNQPSVAKRGSKGHKNVYWDRFIPFGCHFSAFRSETENQKNFDFEAILAILGPFGALLGPFWALLGPLGASGALKGRGELAKSGQKGVKRP